VKSAQHNVRFIEKPQIQYYEEDDNIILSALPDLHITSEKRLRLYFANFTSFGMIAQQILFEKAPSFDIACGVEHHKELSHIKSVFKAKGFSVSGTNPEPVSPFATTKAKGHGGEFIASRMNLDCKPVELQILESISNSTAAPLRFAASYCRLKGITILILSLYMWDGEQLSERNENILNQIYILLQIIRLPFLCCGDFNMHPDVIKASDWPSKLKAVVRHPAVTSTLNNNNTSLIDFCLISESIQQILLSITLDPSVSWSPHFGLYIEVAARPLEIKGLALCKPAPPTN